MKAKIIDVRNSCYLSTVKNYNGTTPDEDIRVVTTGFDNLIDAAYSVEKYMNDEHGEVGIDYIQMHYLNNYIDHSENN